MGACEQSPWNNMAALLSGTEGPASRVVCSGTSIRVTCGDVLWDDVIREGVFQVIKLIMNSRKQL